MVSRYFIHFTKLTNILSISRNRQLGCPFHEMDNFIPGHSIYMNINYEAYTTAFATLGSKGLIHYATGHSRSEHLHDTDCFIDGFLCHSLPL